MRTVVGIITAACVLVGAADHIRLTEQRNAAVAELAELVKDSQLLSLTVTESGQRVVALLNDVQRERLKRLDAAQTTIPKGIHEISSACALPVEFVRLLQTGVGAYTDPTSGAPSGTPSVSCGAIAQWANRLMAGAERNAISADTCETAYDNLKPLYEKPHAIH